MAITKSSSKSKSKSKQPAPVPTPFHANFCWNELMTRHLDRAKAYYATTLGWQFEPMPMADGRTYWIIKSAGHPMGVGGMLDISGPDYDGMPDQWVPYVAVDHVDTRVKTAVKAGASVMMAPADIPNVGRIAALRQPGGAMIYFMTPAVPSPSQAA